MESLGSAFAKLAAVEQRGVDVVAKVDVCSICRGIGWVGRGVPVGHPDFGKLFTCECQQERIEAERHGRFVKYWNLEGMSRFTFEALDSDVVDLQFAEAWQAAVAYAAAPDGWLTFVGPNGGGKTHLAAAIAHRAIANSVRGYFVDALDLLDDLRETFNPSSDVSYSELFDRVREVPLLVLDGLEGRGDTAWAERKLRQILGRRSNAPLATVITTAVPLDSIDPYIAARIRRGKVVEVGTRG